MPYILPLQTIHSDDINNVGYKAVSLGELHEVGLPVPPGFVITTEALQAHLEQEELFKQISQELLLLNKQNPESLKRTSKRIQQHILAFPLPKPVAKAIFDAYEALCNQTTSKEVAIRASRLEKEATPEKNPLYLNIIGENTVAELTKEVWLAAFSSYQLQKHPQPLKNRIAVIVQTMVDSDVAGLLHTFNTKTEDRHEYTIEAVFGLGEYLTHTKEKPDQYTINKQTFKVAATSHHPQTTYLTRYRNKTEIKSVSSQKQDLPKLTTEHLKTLTEYGNAIHKLHYYPQTVEWVLKDTQFYIVQTQPYATAKQSHTPKVHHDAESRLPLPVLLEGIGGSPGMVTATVQFVDNAEDIRWLRNDEIAVVKQLTTDLYPFVRHCKGIITDLDGENSPAALIARELGVPAVLGTQSATKTLKANQIVTIDGGNGLVYSGTPNTLGQKLSFSRTQEENQLKPLPPIVKTTVKVFADLPTASLTLSVESAQPDGIAMVRGELVIASLAVHPKKLLTTNRNLEIVAVVKKQLMDALTSIPHKDIYYCLSDFTSDQMRKLGDGHGFEPIESNPLLGFRGSLRHLYHPQLLEAELSALKQIREHSSVVHVVIPMVRSKEEFDRMKSLLAKYGLAPSSDLKVWLALSTPANLINLPQYVKSGLDGIVINQDVLTTFMLGVDPSNTEVLPLFNELDPACQWLIDYTIRYAHKQDVPVIVISKAAGKYPHYTETLVRNGVSGIAVPPDLVVATRRYIAKTERKLIDL